MNASPKPRSLAVLLAPSLIVAACATGPRPAVQAPAPVETLPMPGAPGGPASTAPSTPAATPLPVPSPDMPRGGGRIPPLSVPAPVVPPAPAPRPSSPRELEARARLQVLLPPTVIRDRDEWAGDIAAAFGALQLAPSAENLCASIAVIEQESGFQADPVVPGLSRIAWKEIETRRQRYGIPKLALDAALSKTSPDGRTYRQRIDSLRTERQMSVLYGDIIDEVPGGKLLLSGYNPVHTGGPMQVSVAFAEEHARTKPYPAPGNGKIREAVFSRRGGLHFGIAHLLDYPVSYSSPLYRFADFNAGHYASRNAAFQLAVARLTGQTLAPDGDLLRYENGEPSRSASATQKALFKLSMPLRLSRGEILTALEQEKSDAFARTALYQRVFSLADQRAGRPMSREVLPRISLKSPKITRKLTTAWFAERVNTRYGSCMGRAQPVMLMPTARLK
ncbi:DUF1615 domain-containing protein [Azoarcus sp. KH32C]|uniref:DUF1615 domain-containing protein n=1 Tax=Azoarcus sp. KH32C TaxID=748247 RepID=UPI0005A07FA4|nr:DUF1615 domain-containing protein [Azoarcus sp. KH32C]